MRLRAVTTVAAMVGTLVVTNSGHAEVLVGAGAEGGYVATKSSEKTENDKRGGEYALYLGGAWTPDQSSYLSLEVGYEGQSVSGNTVHYAQTVRARGLLASLDYRYDIGDFEPGLLLRLDDGHASTLRAADENTVKGVLSGGVELAYRFKCDQSDFVAYVAATHDFGIVSESNTRGMLGIQYWLSVAGSHNVAASSEPTTPVAAQPANNPVPPPPPVAAMPAVSAAATAPAVAQASEAAAPTDAAPALTSLALRFKPETFAFQPNTAKLTAASRKNAKDIGKALAGLAGGWTAIEVDGHSDGNTKNPARNQELSEQRASAVQAELVKQKLDAAVVTAKGFGATQPLAGKDPKDAANRRVELKLEGVKNPEAVNEALKKYLAND